MTRCEAELCRNWSGDGNVCPCAVFGIEPDVVCGRCGCTPEWCPCDEQEAEG
jgi:hypothetical protein